MANYRRLISYLYAYDGSVKGNNVGFAKVEVRSGQCRLNVSVKKIYMAGNDMGVYLLSGKQEICLGKMFVRGGAGEFRAVVNADNVENSGISMEQCYGLTIHDVESDWQCYKTIWDDAVTHAAEIELAEVTADKISPEESVDEMAERVRREVEKEIEEDARAEQMAEAGQTVHIELEDVGQQEKLYGSEMEQSVEDGQNHQADLAAEQVLGQTDVELGENERKEEGEPQLDNANQRQNQQKSTTAASASENVQQEEIHRIPDPSVEIPIGNWDYLRKNYAKLQAFDYGNECETLTIKPQDIGLLPRENWVYGNNSFLLHGYYNYRYLILSKLKNRDGKYRYLLGVPGHYYSNEKYMAAMFGFPNFVLARQQAPGDGRFGYWYTDIRL